MTEPKNLEPAITGSKEFRRLGKNLIDRISDEMELRDSRPLTCHKVPEHIENEIRSSPLPINPSDAEGVLQESMDLMFNYSLFTAHPRFLGYVCPAADPMGTLADTLVASINPNAASALMTPIGHTIEQTVIRWLGTILGFPGNPDGILVSGGNVANIMGILIARQKRAPWPIRECGFNHPDARPLRIYTTEESHNGFKKSAEIAGMGNEAGIKMIEVDSRCRMRVEKLRSAIIEDKNEGIIPICVAATIGTVGTGAIDPIEEIVSLAEEENVSVHIDGSYGAAMALAPDIPEEFTAVPRVDTISWDPHKWLRVPYEAGCLLAREEGVLSKTFSHRPSYYTFNDYSDVDHYYEKGFQNSRHLRALKVWMSLKQHGTEGHSKFIARDLTLTGLFHEAVKKQKNLQALFCNLCVSTFRFVPDELADGCEDNVAILDKINAEIVDETQKGGNFYITNAIVQEAFYLRVCFVNSQTQESDIPIILDDIVRQGHKVHDRIRDNAAACGGS